ncbi:MAG: hypothetical protein OXH15_05865, partial [Gammaproteobacteria bacterium]|nr:hypothetical protein [Gammaproteobacteria bacterium]
LIGVVLLYLAAMVLLFLGKQFWVYACGVSLFFFAWLFALPYLVSAVAELDKTGRATALVTACLAFGSMLGPAVGGELVERGDFFLLYVSGSVVTCVAYAVVLAAIRKGLASRLL